jgi:hypothetical protein
MAFPLDKLSYTLVPASLVPRVAVPPNPGDLWRINFSRVEYHVIVVNGTFQKDPRYSAEDNWVWSPQSAIGMHKQPLPLPFLSCSHYICGIVKNSNASTRSMGLFTI